MPDPRITKVHLTSKFKKSFRKLPKHIQSKAIKKDKLFRVDPFNSRLDTHKLAGELKSYLSYSIDYHYRVLFRFLSEEEVIYFNIGTHDIYR